MNRPRLGFVKEYFIGIENEVNINNETLKIMEEYNKIKDEQGEFLAGRFLIEVYIETQQTMEEIRNAKKKARI